MVNLQQGVQRRYTAFLYDPAIVVICSDEKVKLIRVISYDKNMEI